MKSKHLSFILELAILCAILVPVNYYVLEGLLNREFTGIFFFSYAYFSIVVLSIHFILFRELKNRPQKYVIAFMGSMGVKIFLSLIVLVIIMYSGIEKSKVFAVNYMLLYLIFSAFSVSQMLRSQKTFSKNQ